MKAAVFPLSVLLLLVLTGCGSFKKGATMQLDDFSSPDVYSHAFPGTPALACEASRRILLGQGYILDEEQPSSIEAHKNFQPNSQSHIEVRFTVTCAPNSRGSNTATVFVNAIKDRYSLRKSSNSASLGIGVFGSFSLPLTSSDDAMVKVASETITARKFYQRFFETIDSHLDISFKPKDLDVHDDDDTTEPASS
jgi:hypothetical protein